MGTFRITNSELNNSYQYKNESIIVNGDYRKDAIRGTLTSVSGSCYSINAQGEQGDYIGNFNGYMRDEEIRYSLSEMSRRNSNLVWDAIDEIEPNITGNQVEE